MVSPFICWALRQERRSRNWFHVYKKRIIHVCLHFEVTCLLIKKKKKRSDVPSGIETVVCRGGKLHHGIPHFPVSISTEQEQHSSGSCGCGLGIRPVGGPWPAGRDRQEQQWGLCNCQTTMTSISLGSRLPGRRQWGQLVRLQAKLSGLTSWTSIHRVARNQRIICAPGRRCRLRGGTAPDSWGCCKNKNLVTR